MDPLRSCLASSYGPDIFSFFPSKAHRIMSRYRPIAPKPSTLPSTSEADRSASSALTFDNVCCRRVPDAPIAIASTPAASASLVKQSKPKRARKRPTRDGDSHRPNKRQVMGCIANQTGQAENVPSFGLMIDGAQMMQDDAGFMERAAASAPPSVLPSEKTRKAAVPPRYGYGGCFTEMIRGIAGLPSSSHVNNLLQHQQQQQPPPASLFQKQQVSPYLSPLPDQSLSQQPANHVGKEGIQENCRCIVTNTEKWISDEHQQSGVEEEGSDGRGEDSKKIVTLSLLPEVPMRTDSPTMSTCSSSPHTALSKSELVVLPGQSSMECIEQMYGHSPEPVVLVDDASQKVLWVNESYSRACKGNLNMPVPFIDPLGIPSRLGHFLLQSDGQGGCTSATLWGFLKKLVFDVSNEDALGYIPYVVGVPYQSATRDVCPDTSPSLDSQKGSTTETKSMVITPQPKRLAGSIVSLDSLTEVHEGKAMVRNVQSLQNQLEEISSPSFVTDELNIVRWVNSAYRGMVGQPECPWLVSTIKAGANSHTITGEVSLSCNVEVPFSASSFSGRANIQWTRSNGERSCMTVPCDVSSVVESNRRRFLVWTFDIQASLSLTCG